MIIRTGRNEIASVRINNENLHTRQTDVIVNSGMVTGIIYISVNISRI